MLVENDVERCMTLSPPVFLPVAIMLKDDYFVRGAGLPGRFKAEKVEFHWGPNNGSEGSEHSINGHRYPVEVRAIYHNPQQTTWQKTGRISMIKVKCLLGRLRVSMVLEASLNGVHQADL